MPNSAALMVMFLAGVVTGYGLGYSTSPHTHQLTEVKLMLNGEEGPGVLFTSQDEIKHTVFADFTANAKLDKCSCTVFTNKKERK